MGGPSNLHVRVQFFFLRESRPERLGSIAEMNRKEERLLKELKSLLWGYPELFERV